MHVFEYIYVSWMNEDGHFPKKANTWLFQVFGQILEQSQAIMS